MSKIIPIRELKDTSNISNMVKETDGPIYVTKNGYEDMIILSVAEYNRITKDYKSLVAENKKLIATSEITKKLMEAERDFADGKYRDHDEVMADMRKKYDIRD